MSRNKVWKEKEGRETLHCKTWKILKWGWEREKGFTNICLKEFTQKLNTQKQFTPKNILQALQNAAEWALEQTYNPHTLHETYSTYRIPNL